MVISREIMSKCQHQSIVVIGDIMLDEYVWCDVSRISPEAPVPICRVRDISLAPGGAANVAMNIRSLGSEVTLIGVVGMDTRGAEIRSLMDAAGVSTTDIIETNDRPTIVKSRIMAHHQHVVRVDHEITTPVPSTIQQIILDSFAQRLSSAGAVLISDYLKGSVPAELIKQLISVCRSKNIPVIVDPKGDVYTHYTGASILTPNKSEFEAVAGKVSGNLDLHHRALKLCSRLKLDGLIVTRSEDGMTVVRSDGQITDIPTLAQEVCDITGAGDTAIAMLAIAISAGLPIDDSAYLANVAAGIVVGKVGTSRTTWEEVMHAVSG